MSLSRPNSQPELGNTSEHSSSDVADINQQQTTTNATSLVPVMVAPVVVEDVTAENLRKLANSVVTYNSQKQTATDASSAHYANMVMEEISNLMDTLYEDEYFTENRYVLTEKALRDNEFPRLIATLETTAAHMNTILDLEQQKPEQAFNINDHLNELNTLSSHYSCLGNEGSTGRKIAGALMIVGGLLALAIAAAAIAAVVLVTHGAALPFAAALVADLVVKFGAASMIGVSSAVAGASLFGVAAGSVTVHHGRERGVIGAFGLFKDAVKAEQKEVASIEHQPEVLAYAAGAGA